MSQPVTPIVSRTQQKALSIAQAALEKKASDVVILDVAELTSVADFFIFGSGESERQVKAIADHIAKEISRQYKAASQVEGAGVATWILLDYGDIVVHIFRTDIREYYGLEKMWSDAPRIPLPEEQERAMSSSSSTIKSTKGKTARFGS